MYVQNAGVGSEIEIDGEVLQIVGTGPDRIFCELESREVQQFRCGRHALHGAVHSVFGVPPVR